MISSYILPILIAGFLAAGLGSRPQRRIIGGTDIVIEQAPWQVSLMLDGAHHCGGSLYSDRIIITAAHCFFQKLQNGTGKRILRLWQTERFLVLAGSELRRSRKYLAAVKEKKHHEMYKYNGEHDIGIMTLVKPFSISRKIRPIDLAIQNPAPGSKVLSTGWGLTNIHSPGIPIIIPENLKGIFINIENFDECKKYLPSMKRHTICAGNAGRSACNGDSGGPLVFNNTLVGVVSLGRKKCDSPVIYTSVAYNHKWLINAITSISNENVRFGNGKTRISQKLS